MTVSSRRLRAPGAFVNDAWNGATRAAIVVFGGMLALQSSNDVDPWKLTYLAAAGIAVCGSLLAVYGMRGRHLVASARPWLIASAVVIAILALSLPVALAGGTKPMDWLRDAAAYALFAAVPWLALDAATSTTSGRLVAMLMVASAVSILSFGIEWIERRHLADLPIDRLTLPSFFLAAAFFALSWAMAQSSSGRRRLMWSLLGGLGLGLILLTGTRSTVVLLAAPAAVALLLLRAKRIVGFVALIGLAAAQVLLAVLIVIAGQSVIRWASEPPAGPSVEGPGSPQPPTTTERLDTIDDVVAGADNSLRERIAQTRAAVDALLDAPLLGVGPGHRFPWPNYAGEMRAGFTLDSPVIVLAKFGILGIVLVLAICVAYARFARQLWTTAPWTAVSTLSVAYGAVAVIWLPLGWPVEDKGFSLSLILILAAGFSILAKQIDRTAANPARPRRVTGRVWRPRKPVATG